MVSPDNIIKFCDKKDLPKRPAVYFIIDDKKERVLYVGQTGDLFSRLNSRHHILQEIENISSCFIDYVSAPEDQNERMKLEYDFISKFRPEFNSTLCKDPRNQNLGVKVSSDELRQINAAIEKSGKTQSDWVRSTILEHLGECCKRKNIILEISELFISKIKSGDDEYIIPLKKVIEAL